MLVFETGRPDRIDSYVDATGQLGTAVREAGARWSVGVPVTVEGRLWGLMGIASTLEQPLPPDTEARLARSPSWWRRRSPTPTAAPS